MDVLFLTSLIQLLWLPNITMYPIHTIDENVKDNKERQDCTPLNN